MGVLAPVLWRLGIFSLGRIPVRFIAGVASGHCYYWLARRRRHVQHNIGMQATIEPIRNSNLICNSNYVRMLFVPFANKS